MKKEGMRRSESVSRRPLPHHYCFFSSFSLSEETKMPRPTLPLLLAALAATPALATAHALTGRATGVGPLTDCAVRNG